MKFWTFYGERWAAKTGHLSMMREGAYLRLCTWMMMHEKALPPNRKDVLAIARAKGFNQEQATDAVLAEFFVLKEDGYHQKTADEILQWWHSSGATSNAKHVDGTRTRVAALRARRTVLVKLLREKGVSVSADIGITAARALCITHGITLPVTEVTGAEVTLPATGNAIGNAFGNALSTIQYPVSVTPALTSGHNGVTDSARNGPEIGENPNTRAPLDAETEDRPGPMSRAIKVMQKAGLDGAYVANRDFVTLLDDGATLDDFRLIATEAVARQKSFSWAMAAMLGRRNDARTHQNGPRSDDQGLGNGLIPPDLDQALQARFNDPAVTDPFDLSDLRHLPARYQSKGEP